MARKGLEELKADAPGMFTGSSVASWSTRLGLGGLWHHLCGFSLECCVGKDLGVLSPFHLLDLRVSELVTFGMCTCVCWTQTKTGDVSLNTRNSSPRGWQSTGTAAREDMEPPSPSETLQTCLDVLLSPALAGRGTGPSPELPSSPSWFGALWLGLGLLLKLSLLLIE